MPRKEVLELVYIYVRKLTDLHASKNPYCASFVDTVPDKMLENYKDYTLVGQWYSKAIELFNYTWANILLGLLLLGQRP